MTLRSKPVHPLTLISARIDRAITAGESRFLDAHMPSCESCQAQDASLREICGMLDANPAPSPPPQAVERLLESLREIGTSQPEDVEPTPASPVRGKAVKPWMLIVPAVIVLVSAVALTGMQRRPPAPPAESAPQEIRSFPTSTTEAPPRTCATGNPESTSPSVMQAEIFEPTSPQAPPPLRAAQPPSKPRSQAAPSRPAVVVHAPVVTATSDPQSVVVQHDADVQQVEPPPVVPETFETFSIYFSGNGKNLNKESRRTLDDRAAWMLTRDDVRLVIEARTDPRKSSKKTLELGHKRALAVARYLEKKGVEPFRLRQEAHENPAAPRREEDEDRTASSDRVDLVPRR